MQMEESTQNYGELLTEVAKLLQRKYTHMAEINRLTQEIAQELQRDDRVNVQLMLGMRGEEIEAVRDCEKKLILFQDSAPPELSEWLQQALKGKMHAEDMESKEKALVVRLAGSVRSVWEKIMVTDRHMSMRLAGDDSFYSGK